jgi:hypothetical protein
MMLDDDIVAVSPSSVYRVLKAAGRLDRRTSSPSKKGTGFVQPESRHTVIASKEQLIIGLGVAKVKASTEVFL